MIAVDTSALLAIAFGEPEAQTFLDILVQSDWVLGTPIALEAHIVIARRGSMRATLAFQELMLLPRLALLPFTAAHTFLARQAFIATARVWGTLHPSTSATACPMRSRSAMIFLCCSREMISSRRISCLP